MTEPRTTSTTPETDRVEEFLAWARNDRGRSPHTLARYAAVLKLLPDPATATVEEIEAWWATRLHLSPATRSNELACLRSFYRWMTRFDHLEEDPTRRITPPKIPSTVPHPIGQTDLDRLLGPLTADALDLRRAIALGAYAGMRVSEAAALTWADIDQESRRIYIRGKGQKERVFALSPVLLDKLLPQVAGNVVTAGGPPYTGAVLQRKVNRLMERHEIPHTFHNLRARGAGLAMAKCGNPVAVAKAFGWASVQTAATYAAVSDETLDQIAAAVV